MGRLFAVLPWCILGFFAILISSEYPQFPERWAVHFDFQSRPNGWMTKSYGAAFFPLGIATALCALFELIARFGVTRNAQLSAPVQEQMVNFNRQLLHFVGVALATFMGYLAWRMPTAPDGSFLWPALLLFVGSVLVGPAIFLRRALQSIKGELPPGYTLLCYSNPDDKRVWVPKLSGMGSTLNFAHRAAWVWMAVLVALPLGMLGLAVVAAVKGR